jgi:glycosyltransferase involved in cell wall biosynthesis
MMLVAGNISTFGNLWTMDYAQYGQDITKTKEFQEADVIHLHWVNQGFLAFKELEKIVYSGKRIVWTMHDEWCFTGGCHYTGDCRQYQMGCECCPYVRISAFQNAAHKAWEKKQQLYNKHNITFVACSLWLKRISDKKALADGQKILAIPNPIDTSIYKPLATPSTNMILFVAQRVDDERKGLKYLDKAVQILKKRGEKVEVLALGRDIPYISDEKEMAELYAKSACFVTPSLQDNLPNTIMEAMACGTPCVGFNVGGIPEMIDHALNGYVARYKDAADLADGISYVIANRKMLGKAAREKVLATYSEDFVAKRYIKVYSEKW